MWSYPVQSRFAWLCVMNPCDDHFLCFCELSTVRDVQEVYWAIWIWPFQLNNEISSRSLSFLNPSPPCRDVRGEIYTLTVEIVENQIGCFLQLKKWNKITFRQNPNGWKMILERGFYLLKNLICEDRLILIEHFVHVHHITDRHWKERD